MTNTERIITVAEAALDKLSDLREELEEEADGRGWASLREAQARGVHVAGVIDEVVQELSQAFHVEDDE